MIEKTIKLKNNALPYAVNIGRQGEHKATKVIFDLSAFIEAYGDGNASMVYNNPNATESRLISLVSGVNTAEWLVTFADTKDAGNGKAELHYYVDDTLAKTAIINVSISKALVVSDEPEDIESWVDVASAKLEAIEGIEDLNELKSAAFDSANDALTYSLNSKLEAEKSKASELSALNYSNKANQYQAEAKASLDELKAGIASGDFKGKDGKDGYTPVKGVDYFDGADGYTPVKGVDYFDGAKGDKGDKGDTYTMTQSDYNTIVAMANTDLSDNRDAAIEAIDNKSTQEQMEIETKGEIVKQSIPQDYTKTVAKVSELNEDLTNITIKKSTSGSSITLTDSADYKVQELKVYGKSVQSGTPTPSTPAEITSVVNPKVSVKNADNSKSNSQTYSYTLRSIGDIKDELIVYADGSGKLVKRIGELSLNIDDMNNIESYPGWKGANDITKFVPLETSASNISCLNIYGNKLGANTLSNNRICYLSTAYYGLTQSEWKTQHAGETIHFYMQLLEPTETTISAETVKTYYPTSIVSVDQSTMDIEYVADTKTYVDENEPSAYVKSASVSGNKLTLTNKDDSKVVFEASGSGTSNEDVLIINSLSTSNEFADLMALALATDYSVIDITGNFTASKITNINNKNNIKFIGNANIKVSANVDTLINIESCNNVSFGSIAIDGNNKAIYKVVSITDGINNTFDKISISNIYCTDITKDMYGVHAYTKDIKINEIYLDNIITVTNDNIGGAGSLNGVFFKINETHNGAVCNAVIANTVYNVNNLTSVRTKRDSDIVKTMYSSDALFDLNIKSNVYIGHIHADNCDKRWAKIMTDGVVIGAITGLANMDLETQENIVGIFGSDIVISNIDVTMNGKSIIGCGGSLKDVTINNANVNGYFEQCVVVAYHDILTSTKIPNVTFSNCNFTGTTEKASGILIEKREDGHLLINNTTIKVSGCTYLIRDTDDTTSFGNVKFQNDVFDVGEVETELVRLSAFEKTNSTFSIIDTHITAAAKTDDAKLFLFNGLDETSEIIIDGLNLIANDFSADAINAETGSTVNFTINRFRIAGENSITNNLYLLGCGVAKISNCENPITMTNMIRATKEVSVVNSTIHDITIVGVETSNLPVSMVGYSGTFTTYNSNVKTLVEEDYKADNTEKFLEINNDIGCLRNFFDLPNMMITRLAVTPNYSIGILNASGEFTPLTGSYFCVSDHISTDKLTGFVLSTTMGYGNLLYAFYDADGNFISGLASEKNGYTTLEDESITIPYSAKTVRFASNRETNISITAVRTLFGYTKPTTPTKKENYALNPYTGLEYYTSNGNYYTLTLNVNAGEIYDIKASSGYKDRYYSVYDAEGNVIKMSPNSLNQSVQFFEENVEMPNNAAKLVVGCHTYYQQCGVNLQYEYTNIKIPAEIEEEPLHTYSTTEQIVGKWIDGKNIYEKTITDISFDTYPAEQVVDDRGIIDTVLDYEAFALSEDGTVWTVPCTRDSITMYGIPISIKTYNNHKVYAVGEGSQESGNITLTITLRYTKVS